jgi:hypothetical protein
MEIEKIQHIEKTMDTKIKMYKIVKILMDLENYTCKTS